MKYYSNRFLWGLTLAASLLTIALAFLTGCGMRWGYTPEEKAQIQESRELQGYIRMQQQAEPQPYYSGPVLVRPDGGGGYRIYPPVTNIGAYPPVAW